MCNNIFDHDVLEDDEIDYLFKEMKNGNKNARDKLILCNTRLVRHIAKGCKLQYDEDSIMAGIIGLIKAVDTYDSSKCKFNTYASVLIRNEIFMGLRKPNAYIKHFSPISIYTEVDDNHGNKVPLINLMKMHEPNTIANDKEIYEAIKNIDITDRDRNIAIMSLGLFGNDALTQTKIAEKYGITQTQVSRIIKKVYNKIVDYMNLFN